MKKKKTSVAILIALLVNLVLIDKAYSITLAWDPSPDVSVTGYAIYIGNASGSYQTRVDVGNVTNSTVTLTNKGVTNFFVVTAYTLDGVESLPSNEVSYMLPVLDNSYTVSSGFGMDRNSGFISGEVVTLPTDAKLVYWAKDSLSVTQGEVLTLTGRINYLGLYAPISVYLVDETTGYWISSERVIYVDGSFGYYQTELAVLASSANAKLFVSCGHSVGVYQFQEIAVTLTSPAIPPVPDLYLKQLLPKQVAGICSAEWTWSGVPASQGYVVRTALLRFDIERGSAGNLLSQQVLPAGQTTYRLDITTPLYGGVYVSVSSLKNGVESAPWITWYLLGDIFKTADDAIPPLCFQGCVDSVDVNFANAGYLTMRRVPALTSGMPACPEERVDIDNNTYAGRTSDLSLIKAQYQNGRRMQ